MNAGTVDLSKAARSAARAALDLLDGLAETEPSLVSEALGARIRADLFLGEGLDSEAADRARRLDEMAPAASVDSRVVFKLGQWRRYVDDLDGARACLAEAERQATAEGDEASLANILLNRIVVETWAGRWREAENITPQMNEAFEQLGLEYGGINPWRAYVDAHAGRLDAARAAAGEKPREPIVAMIWSRCLGLAELAAGDPEAADRHLAEAMLELDRVDFRQPAMAGRRRRDRGDGRGGGPRPCALARRALRAARRPLAHPLEPGRVGALPRMLVLAAKETWPAPSRHWPVRSVRTRTARCRSSERGRC